MKDQTTVKLPANTKKQVRIVAAELGTSMGNAALELIKIGLAEYQKTANCPLYADRNPAPMGAAMAEGRLYE
jgi:plasmid stability protein